MASVGEVELGVVPDLSAFGALLASGVSKSLGPVESLITSRLGLALGGAFAVFSVSQATEFETSMNRLVGLVGLSRDEVQGLSNDILSLGGTLPQSPKELADALFFIESAGQRGQQAIDTLTVSAEAAAAGLGSTKVVADAVTSAMNTYSQSNLTAAHATDIMIAAVREGKLEPSLFAAQLGQVLPVAAQLGITFDQVAASIASSTREGLSAARAATGTRFLISSFIRPTAASVSALNSIGITVDSLQAKLKNQGLLPTLQELAHRFDLTTAAGRQLFATVVGGTRGMAVAAILVGENGKAVQDIFANVADSSGSLATAWAAAGTTLKVQIGEVKSAVEAFAISFGQALLPAVKTGVSVLKSILGPIIGVATWLTKVPGLVSGVAVAFASWKVLQFVTGLLTKIQTGLENFAAKAAAAGTAQTTTNEEVSASTESTATVVETATNQMVLAIERLVAALESVAPASVGAEESLAGLAGTEGAEVFSVESLSAAYDDLAISIFAVGDAESVASGMGIMQTATAGLGRVAGGAAAGLAALSEIFVPLAIGATAISLEFGYFSGVAAKNQQEVDNLTTSITGMDATLGPLQQNLGLTNDQLTIWLTKQRLGVDSNSVAGKSWQQYDATVGRSLRNILDVNTKVVASNYSLELGLGGLQGSTVGLVAQAPRIQTLWDTYGTGIENSLALTNQQKVAVSSQLAYFTELGGSLTGVAKRELDFAERTGDASAIMTILDESIKKLAPSLDEVGKSVTAGASQFKGFQQIASSATLATGLSFTELEAQARQVFISDGHTFGQNWDKFTASITDSYDKAQTAIVDGLDFLGTKLQSVFSQKSYSAADILHGIQSATGATIKFGQNLGTITKIGNGAGKALAQYFATLGPAGALAAAKVAGASDKAQASIVDAYNRNRSVLTKVGQDVSTQILGVLQKILGFMKEIASQHWSIPAPDTTAAAGKIQDLQSRIDKLKDPITIQATVKYYAQAPPGTVPPINNGSSSSSSGGSGGSGGGGGGGGSPTNGPSYKPTATGGIIHGATGFITKRPTYLVGEGSYSTAAFRGSEAVIPLNSRGRKFVRDAWGMGGGQKMVGELTLTPDSKAYIRAVIHEEVSGAYVDKKLGRRMAGRR